MNSEIGMLSRAHVRCRIGEKRPTIDTYHTFLFFLRQYSFLPFLKLGIPSSGRVTNACTRPKDFPARHMRTVQPNGNALFDLKQRRV